MKIKIGLYFNEENGQLFEVAYWCRFFVVIIALDVFGEEGEMYDPNINHMLRSNITYIGEV